MEALGVFDKSRNGSGTITAVAAIYIAARAAARPLSGLLHAAYLPNADTDTLASMCASLLGAIHGTSWLGALGEEVQDARYLRNVSMRLADPNGPAAHRQDSFFVPEELARTVHARSIEDFRNSIFDMETGTLPEVLPDRRRIAHGRIEKTPLHLGTLARASLRIVDGQTLVVDRFTRRNAESVSATKEVQGGSGYPLQGATKQRLTSISRVTEIRLRVNDLEQAIRFYRDVLNVSVWRISNDSIRLNGGIILTQASRSEMAVYEMSASRDLLITISVTDFDEVVHRVIDADIIEVVSVTDSGSLRQMRLRDPDGHDLQIVAASPGV
jgi:catechol 2,3-dioxygenase-like lactoylglutathione lyase family enzyme